MELAARAGQHPLEVAEALEVGQQHLGPGVADAAHVAVRDEQGRDDTRDAPRLPATGQELVALRHPGGRAELGERLARGLPLQPGQRLVAGPAVGGGEDEPGTGRLVRRTDLAPRARGQLGGGPAAGHVAREQRGAGARELGGRREGEARVALGDIRQRVGSGGRHVRAPRRGGDLHLRRQQRRQPEVPERRLLLRRVLVGPLDRRADQVQRHLVVPLRRAQQGEPRLGRPHVPVRLQERRLGAGQVTPPEPDGAELDQRPAVLAPQPRAELGARAQRLLLGGVGGPAEAEQLGPVHAAPAVDRTERGVVTPPLHDVGPLARPVVHAEGLRGADELAEHHPGRQRVDLPGHQQGGHLVQLGEPGLDVALQDAEAADRGPADDHGRQHTERARPDPPLPRRTPRTRRGRRT